MRFLSLRKQKRFDIEIILKEILSTLDVEYNGISPEPSVRHSINTLHKAPRETTGTIRQIEKERLELEV